MRKISRGAVVLATMALSAVTAVPANATVPSRGGPPPAHGRMAGAAAEIQPGPGRPVRTHQVTLITGDVVQLAVYADGRQAATVRPDRAEAGQHGFETYVLNKQAYLIPDSARPYLATGRLDRELFNVTRLIEQGYDDAHRTSLPLIASYAAPGQNPARARARLAQPAPAGARKVRTLASVGAVALTEEKKQAKQFWQALGGDRTTAAARDDAPQLAGGIAKIWLDAQVKASLDQSVPQIGAPAAWQAGYDGTGVKVAVLDTGIDADHPDVAGKIDETRNFSDAPSIGDKVGHGTHVAATVAGLGAASGGRRKGVAPGARLLIGKVLGDTGSGPESSVIAGMEWGAANAKVVSMSLGDATPTDGTDPMSQAVNNLSASTGALFVIAAGNSGPREGTIASPGAADAALTVGAVTKANALAGFSSRGPRFGDHAIKPEISAPGVDIVAARAAGTLDPYAVDKYYARLSGTSMATPHVAGAAAILAQAHPDWNGAQLKAGLTGTALAADGQTVYQQGAGRVDVAHAVREKVSTDAGTLSLGRFTGPFADVKPVHRTVTYRNNGDHDLTLDLTLTASANGTPAPAAMLAVAPTSLTLPAGGTAQATVTLDVNAGEEGLYGGRLLATEHGATGPAAAALTTAVGFDKQVIHKVTVTGLGRDGQSAGEGWWSSVDLWNTQTGEYFPSFLHGGTTTFEVRPGQFALFAYLATMDAGNQVPVEYTAAPIPSLTVDRDLTLTLDARTAKVVDVRTPRPTAPESLAQTTYRKVGDRGFSTTRMHGYYVDRLSAIPTPPVTDGQFEYVSRMGLGAPPLTMKAVSPDLVLHPEYLSWDRIDGHHRLPVVFVGAGRPEDYEGRDVRGKIALIRETPGIPAADQVRDAAAAKAGFALIVAKAPGWLYQSVPAGLPIVSAALPYAEGSQLLGRLEHGRVSLDLVGIAYSPYQYQLLVPETGRIPDDLTHRLTPADLATVENDFHAVSPGQVGRTGFFAFRPYDFFGLLFPAPTPFPFHQSVYFLANDSRYSQYVAGASATDEMYGPGFIRFTPGSRTAVGWFKGPLVPGVSTTMLPVRRTNDDIQLNFGEFLDSEPNHVLGSLGADTAARVYRDGELVFQSPHAIGHAPVGVPEPATYRVELDVNKGRPGWTVSTESYSAWTFHSAAGPKDTPVTLPVLVDSWDLDLDGNNAAPAAAPFTLRLRAGHQPTAAPIPVTGAKVWVSYDDGGTWKRVADLHGTDAGGGQGGYQGTVRHPRKVDSSGYVSLRVQLTDEQGNRLDQTVMRAYALK